MATWIKDRYEDGCFIDGYFYKSVKSSWYEQDGLLFVIYSLSKPFGHAYVRAIYKDVVSVTTPDYIDTKYGNVKVSKWAVNPITDGSQTIKEITFSKAIDDISKSSCEGFSQLETVTFCANVNSIPSSFFKGCTNLKKITFPEDSPIEQICGDCFNGCVSLKEVCLPNNLKTIEKNVFKGCDNLNTISISSSSPDLIKIISAVPSIKSIIIKEKNQTTYLGMNDIEIIRAQLEQEEQEKIRKRYKFYDYESYEKERSDRRLKGHILLCSLPIVIYLSTHLSYIYERSNLLGVILVVFLSFVVLIISVFFTSYIDYYTAVLLNY